MFRYIAIFVVLVIVFGLAGRACGWFGEALDVAQEEFGPRAMLRKYETLKNMAGQLTAKKKQITNKENQIGLLEQDYLNEDGTSVSPRRWRRDDRVSYNQWRQELSGMKMSFNQLAAEYNTQMAKFNWRFAKVGKLPEGANEVLPGKGEFSIYID